MRRDEGKRCSLSAPLRSSPAGQPRMQSHSEIRHPFLTSQRGRQSMAPSHSTAGPWPACGSAGQCPRTPTKVEVAAGEVFPPIVEPLEEVGGDGFAGLDLACLEFHRTGLDERVDLPALLVAEKMERRVPRLVCALSSSVMTQFPKSEPRWGWAVRCSGLRTPRSQPAIPGSQK